MKKISLKTSCFLFLIYIISIINIYGKNSIKVGFSQMEYNNPFRIAETNSIKEEAQKRGYEFYYTDAKGELSNQIANVKYLISQKIDYLILAPREYYGLTPALQAAKKAGIPVILVDRDTAGIPGADYATLISSDFLQQGKTAANWLVNICKGKANIVELQGTVRSSVVLERTQGFRQIISKYKEMKIITVQSGDFSRVKAQKVMENIIQSKKKIINAIYAHNDEMAIGAIQALKAAGIIPGKDLILVSIDGEQDALKAIIAGELGATVECNPRFGPIVFDVIEKLQRDERVPTKIVIPDRFFDLSNAKYYINEAY